MLDPNETASIQAQLNNPTNAASNLVLSFGTDNGVDTTDSVAVT